MENAKQFVKGSKQLKIPETEPEAKKGLDSETAVVTNSLLRVIGMLTLLHGDNDDVNNMYNELVPELERIVRVIP